MDHCGRWVPQHSLVRNRWTHRCCLQAQALHSLISITRPMATVPVTTICLLLYPPDRQWPQLPQFKVFQQTRNVKISCQSPSPRVWQDRRNNNCYLSSYVLAHNDKCVYCPDRSRHPNIVKGTVTQKIFSLKSVPKGCKGLWNNRDLQR